MSLRSWPIQARRGAENEAFGLYTISFGSQLERGLLESHLAGPSPDLLPRPQGERGLEHCRVHERHPDLGRGGHARPVGVGEVEARAGSAGCPPGTSG